MEFNKKQYDREYWHKSRKYGIKLRTDAQQRSINRTHYRNYLALTGIMDRSLLS
jgi:hypothetical protein